MAVEHVTVLDTGPVFVRISARDTQHCAQCAMKSGCGHQLFSAAINRQRNDQTLLFPLAPALREHVRTGDILDLSIHESRLISLSFLQYVLPITGMLLGTAVASKLAAAAGAGEGWVIVTALCALGAGLGAVRMIASSIPLPVTLAVPATELADDAEKT